MPVGGTKTAREHDGPALGRLPHEKRRSRGDAVGNGHLRDLELASEAIALAAPIPQGDESRRTDRRAADPAPPRPPERIRDDHRGR